ncbi:MAG: ParA family protein [Gammaproteobacteria bacterium]|nr:ParA family protein [Gammaproteobacteria bacterium]MDH3413887.1 ParA family protein [Gammaproteobacteria bacterium]
MNTTVVMNAKGGVGKTTIATNLASYFAANGVPTAIMDYDPQGSSLRWIEQRAPEAPHIHGADAAPRKGTGLRSLGRFVPRETRQLVVDAPAGPTRLLMQEMLARANAILIPVAPSKIDIRATANFIKELLLVGGVRHRNIRAAVVANRARSSTGVYEPLERFVRSLRLTFLTHLLDSEVYVESGDTGYGIFEIDAERTAQQRREFMPIVRWVDQDALALVETSANVIRLAHPRAS